MNKYTLVSRIAGFFRTGYPTDAPRLGHVALIAMCPAAASVVHSTETSRNRLGWATFATTVSS
ncbi:hypothetical protein A5784_17360 [Mycobacterium sp. 852013-50091_SCH5140682]|uniref:hypothetical protein n=1 Tax=Mycobacterium sp. 852013-50091_SCH5140682 TaxID=1834109 RepID=UPI0007EADFD0|nr:hypothetical protein [Mycobacterium sp. 852013-50091_SCH5140682]OBC01864.1 hypothetical protein A5784_17360 [Mycobacterium sp. 852013-50091_SCH5140682]